MIVRCKLFSRIILSCVKYLEVQLLVFAILDNSQQVLEVYLVIMTIILTKPVFSARRADSWALRWALRAWTSARWASLSTSKRFTLQKKYNYKHKKMTKHKNHHLLDYT